MADLKKLDNAVSELEKTSKKLKGHAELYSKIEASRKEITQNLGRLERAISLLENHDKRIEEVEQRLISTFSSLSNEIVSKINEATKQQKDVIEHGLERAISLLENHDKRIEEVEQRLISTFSSLSNEIVSKINEATKQQKDVIEHGLERANFLLEKHDKRIEEMEQRLISTEHKARWRVLLLIIILSMGIGGLFFYVSQFFLP